MFWLPKVVLIVGICVICLVEFIFYINGSRGSCKETIIKGRAINLDLLDKNLLLRGHCLGRIFEDLRCNSARGPILVTMFAMQTMVLVTGLLLKSSLSMFCVSKILNHLV